MHQYTSNIIFQTREEYEAKQKERPEPDPHIEKYPPDESEFTTLEALVQVSQSKNFNSIYSAKHEKTFEMQMIRFLD